MNYLIADDEAPARSRMQRLLEPFKNLNFVGEASTGVEVLELNQKLKPDLIFLDIDMPEISGLSVASILASHPQHAGPLIVFVTAHNEHALKAFELSAFDYLVKPVSAARLKICVERISKLFTEKIAQNFASVLQQPELQKNLGRFALQIGHRFVVIDLHKIAAIVAKDHSTTVHVEGKEFFSDESLETWLARLATIPNADFLRSHRSAIVNIHLIRELIREADRKYVAVLDSKIRIPVSREKLDVLKATLGIQKNTLDRDEDP